MNPCLDLPRFTAGTLDDAEHAAFEEHLLTCSACRRGDEAAATAALTTRPVTPWTCTGTKRNGAPCARYAGNLERRCWQHPKGRDE